MSGKGSSDGCNRQKETMPGLRGRETQWKGCLWHHLAAVLLLLSHFSHVQLCATPSLGFSRQEYWSGLPFPSPVHESEKWKWSRSVVSDSSRPHGLQPTRLLRPWVFPGKSTGVGCHCLLWFGSHTCLLNWRVWGWRQASWVGKWWVSTPGPRRWWWREWNLRGKSETCLERKAYRKWWSRG